MPAENELEVKMAVADPRLFAKILADPDVKSLQLGDGPLKRQFEALYYDTSDFALQKAGIAYRIRREGEDWVATVKCDKGSSGALFSREEINEKIPRPDPSAKYFTGTNLGDRLSLLLGEARLQLLFSTKFERTTLLLKTGSNSLAELALDHGMIWSGSVGCPISELELELKEGNIGDILNLAGWFAGVFHLHPEPLSKYARGLALIGMDQTRPDFNSASGARLTPPALLSSCAGAIFAAQAESIQSQCVPDTIRTLRIQIRKLRSLVKFFQPILPQEGLKLHTEKLSQWGELLGNIRDLDILQKAWHDFSNRCNIFPFDAGNWIGVVSERRDFLAATALYKLEQGELTRSLFELQGWLMQGDYLRDASAEIEKALRKSLLTAVKELRGEIGAIEGIPEIRQLHVLRIRIKRLRYLLEALVVVPGYQDEVFLSSLKKLQTLIGKINDVYQIKRLLGNFEAGEDETPHSVQRELFIGWRSRDALRNFFSLPGAFEVTRKAAKNYLRTLTTLRSGRRAKAGHYADPHEPGK